MESSAMWEVGSPGKTWCPLHSTTSTSEFRRQLAQPVAKGRVARVGDRPLTAVEEVAEATQVGHVDDLDGAEAQWTRLLPRPVHLDEAQVEPGARHGRHRAHRTDLVHGDQVGLNPGRPHDMDRPAATDLRRRLEQERPTEAVVGVEVRDHHHLHLVDGEPAATQVGQRGG